MWFEGHDPRHVLDMKVQYVSQLMIYLVNGMKIIAVWYDEAHVPIRGVWLF